MVGQEEMMKITLGKFEFVSITIMVLILSCEMVYAGWFGKVKNIMADKIHYQIKVIDESGKSISGAALWSSEIDKDDDSDWNLVMNRLFQRYYYDYDYARPLGLMTSRMVVEYADSKGELDWVYTTKRTPKMVFAILKRGYFPVSIVVQSEKNKKQELIFKLKRNLDDIVDPRMDKFDELRGDIFNSEKMGVMSEERHLYIQDRQQKIRKIASELENEKPELAARIFLNLADLPRVIYFRDSEENAVINGFSNGFDVKDSDRVIDFEKGLSLDSTTPELQTIKITHQENKDKIRLEQKDKKVELMRVGLQKVKAIVDTSSNRVWPNTYIWIVYRYIALDDYVNACSALKYAHKFESASESKESWMDLASEINRSSAKLGVESCSFVLD